MEVWLYYRPSSGYEGGIKQFVFADLEGSGRYTQIYSSESGEVSDARIYFNTAGSSNR